jgi:16S rRNA (cytosine967-C5)-methyltransferase
VDRALRASALDARDRAFASNLAFQALRWEGTLDWALGHVVRRSLDDVEDGLRDLLRIGAWQLLYGRMPDRAAVSATVDVARSELGARTVGFTNGVLRNLARRRDALPWPPADSVDGRALRMGYPRWVVEAADVRFGADADRQLAAGNEPAGLTVRAADPATVQAALTGRGAQVRPGALAQEALHVEGMSPAAVLEAAPEAVIQDEASMVVGHAAAAAVPDGVWVLDVCAAPGGKATHLAALGRQVIAADRSATRLGLVDDLARRLGRPVPLVVADGTRSPWRFGAFGGVLLDAPCSGLGVVRRRPELRWRRDVVDVGALATVQQDLIAAAADAVAPGGALVYSVCTWTRRETVDVVRAFLSSGDDFAVEPHANEIGTIAEDDGPGRLLTTADHGCDGMYLAVLRRRADGAPDPARRR